MAARRLRLIGIGAGDPDQLTLQALAALRETQVFLVFDKAEATGRDQDSLADARRALLERHLEPGRYRVISLTDPARDRTSSDYATTVTDWHGRRAELLAAALRDQVTADEQAALLVWGDTSLYDSTIRIVRATEPLVDFALDWDVIPGITSVQALTAEHRIPLNRVGEDILITTGRRLADGLVQGHRNVVVMLGAEFTADAVAPEFDVFWGANLGTPEQSLISGPAAEVAETIRDRRRQLHDEQGWVMDVFLLRSPDYQPPA